MSERTPSALVTITSYPPSTGGAEVLTHQLLKHLAPRCRGRVVTAFTENRSDFLLGTTLRAADAPRRYEIDGVPVTVLGLPRAVRWRMALPVALYYPTLAGTGKWLGDLMTPPVAEIAAEEPPDVFHAVRIGREPLTWATHACARQASKPFVLMPVHHPRWNSWIYRSYHALYRSADAILCLSEGERAELESLGVPHARTHLLGGAPTLADETATRAAHERLSLPQGPMVLFLGQKRPYKGIAELVAAAELVWRRHPDAAFVFAGPPTPFSRALFAKTRDRRIVELGNVDLAEKTALIERCDVMCLPSTQESFGLVIVEAWAKRKPVVACDIPALRSVVDDGVNGVLCQQTPASIAAALDSLLASAEKREAMGRAGLAKQQERYTWERLAAALLRIYESL